MKIYTADLADAQLDYWTARAQGVPREFLDIRQVQRTDVLICVLRKLSGNEDVFNPHENWHLAGALIEQHRIFIGPEFSIPNHLSWKAKPQFAILHAIGPTPLIAICRAIVRNVYGEQVEEIAVTE